MSKQRTKDEIISDLKSEIVGLCNKVGRLETKNQELNNFVDELKKIFEIDEYSWSGDKYSKIIEASKFVVNKNDELVNYRDAEVNILRNENNKFFNLIRSLAGDKTLEKEMEMQSDVICNTQHHGISRL